MLAGNSPRHMVTVRVMDVGNWIYLCGQCHCLPPDRLMWGANWGEGREPHQET